MSIAIIQYVPTQGSAISVWAFSAQSQADRTAPFPLAEELANFEAETLILFGLEEAICSVAASEWTREGIKRSKLVVLENCGHFPWVEKPEEFFREVTVLGSLKLFHEIELDSTAPLMCLLYNLYPKHLSCYEKQSLIMQCQIRRPQTISGPVSHNASLHSGH